MTKEEVTIEELEKRIRNLRENYRDFAVITIAAILLIWIRLVWGTAIEGNWIEFLIVLLMFVATTRICYLYRHREDN